MTALAKLMERDFVRCPWYLYNPDRVITARDYIGRTDSPALFYFANPGLVQCILPFRRKSLSFGAWSYRQYPVIRLYYLYYCIECFYHMVNKCDKVNSFKIALFIEFQFQLQSSFINGQTLLKSGLMLKWTRSSHINISEKLAMLQNCPGEEY